MKTLVIDKNTPLNGTTKGNGKGTGTGANTALAVIEKPDTKTEAKKEEPKQLSFEDRKNRSKELAVLFDKHDKLKKHSEELLGIVKADENVNTRFYLESSNGDEWQTTNQEFIKKTIKVMHEAIQEKILETEILIEQIQIG